MKPSSSIYRWLFQVSVAVWLTAVGTGVSLTHVHGGEAEAPHRHLILFGIECPAEVTCDADGSGDWQAPLDPPAEASEAAPVTTFVLPPSPQPLVLVTTVGDLPTCHASTRPLSVRPTRSAVLRA